MRRFFYRHLSANYLHILRLIATHFREKRIRAGLCYAPGCQQHGVVWLDRAGIFCWDHYCVEMEARRSGDVERQQPQETTDG